MRLWLYISVFYALSSCSVQYHIQRAEKHREKALNKGAIFTPDTIRIDGDTTFITYFKNDTLFVEREVVRNIYLDGEIRYVTRVDKKREYKIIRQKNRLNAKQVRVETRQEAKTDRTEVRRTHKNRWYIWLIIGLVTGFFLKQIITFLLNKYLP